MAYNRDAKVDLTVGSQYRVCALSLYFGSIMILLHDDTRLPGWYPVGLFDVIDHGLPADWGFASYPASTALQALWGYPEMVEDDSHYDAILERDETALATLMSRCRSDAP
jgi:hypothetical protein